MVCSLAALLSTAAAAALAACLLTPAESDLVTGCHGWSWLLPYIFQSAIAMGDWIGEKRNGGEGKGTYGLLRGDGLGGGGHGLRGLDLLLDDGRHLRSHS